MTRTGPDTAPALPLGEAGSPAPHTFPGGPLRPSSVPGDDEPVEASASSGQAPAQESDPAPQQPARRGPGRNLKAAIGVGVLLGAAIVVFLFVIPWAFPLFVGLALVLAVLEVTRALREGGLHVPAMPVFVGVIGMVVCTVVFDLDGLVLSAAIAVCVVILWRVTESMGLVALRDVAAGVFTIAWVPFLGCFTLLLMDRPDGAMLVFVAMLIPIMNDLGGYIAGVLFGRHPMAPSISPKKSWEGFVGSLLFGVTAAVVGLTLVVHVPWWAALVIGVVLVIVSTCGDLSESLLKRDLGIKDMGHLLPGHGGVMDRIDSILLAAPTTYILLEVLL
jgi:phosphatidate cytidylyltransferase